VIKFWLKILLLSSLALMIELAPASTQPKLPEPTQPEKLYTEAQALAAAQAAVDKAVPLAVQAAVAQIEGELAGMKAEKKAEARKAALWRVLALLGITGIAGSLIDAAPERGAAYGAAAGAVGGAVWWAAEHWPPWR
jgi:hypothetical protein